MVTRYPYIRIYLVGLLLLSLFVGVGARHLYIITESSQFLMENNQARTERRLAFTAARGEIKDRHGAPLAVALPYYKLKVISDLFHPNASELKKLSLILGVSVKDIQSKVKKRAWFYLPMKLEADQVKGIGALNLEGLVVEKRPGRFYPLGSAGAQLVGILGHDGFGLLGAEYQFDQNMQGADGSMRYSQNLLGQIHEVYENHAARDGNDLVLSIDARMQQLGWEVLKKAVEHHQASSASAVILDVATGDVLSILNYPSFDPNVKLDQLSDATKNKAISDLFEPGSIIKPLVMSVILSQKNHQMDEVIEIDPEGLKLGDKIIQDHRYFDKVRVEDVLLKSSNIAMVKLTQALSKDALVQGLDRLGIFTSSYIALPGETIGRHGGARNQVERATMSYGYGLAVNLVSMAKAYNVIANRGRDVGVHILKHGTRVEPEIVLSSAVCDTVTGMMERVVQYGVSSKNAAVKGISVAGKSGTTRLLAADGHYESAYVSSFVGFAPSRSPKVVVAVMVRDPKKNGYYGGQVAAPMFSKLVKLALHYYQSKEGSNVGDQRVLSYPVV